MPVRRLGDCGGEGVCIAWRLDAGLMPMKGPSMGPGTLRTCVVFVVAKQDREGERGLRAAMGLHVAMADRFWRWYRIWHVFAKSAVVGPGCSTTTATEVHAGEWIRMDQRLHMDRQCR